LSSGFRSPVPFGPSRLSGFGRWKILRLPETSSDHLLSKQFGQMLTRPFGIAGSPGHIFTVIAAAVFQVGRAALGWRALLDPPRRLGSFLGRGDLVNDLRDPPIALRGAGVGLIASQGLGGRTPSSRGHSPAPGPTSGDLGLPTGGALAVNASWAGGIKGTGDGRCSKRGRWLTHLVGQPMCWVMPAGFHRGHPGFGRDGHRSQASFLPVIDRAAST